MISFALTDMKDGPMIEADKEGATYHIKVMKTDDGQKNAVVEDTQRIPFWRNLKRKDDFFKLVKSKVSDLTTEKWDFVCVELSAADEDGNIGEEKPEIRGEAEITDKFITDKIMTKHLFYCDITDINQTLYVFARDHWGNSEAESLILNELSEIFKVEERRRGMMKERATDFIKGQSMNLKLTPKPPELIPFKNGLYDLTTEELKAHDPKYFYTNVIPHDYTPDARCPNFMKWLGEVIKLDDMEFLQEWMGYNFYASYPEPGFLVLIGTGQNAKSCFSRLFKQLIGEKNVTEISLAALTYDDFAPAQLEHKLANISDDIGSTTIANTGRLKRVSSGSGITVARKFQQEHDITPYAKPTYSCNAPPEIKDSSDAIKLRLKVVEFPYVFVKNPVEGQKQARDRREVDTELEGEIPGIINWALEGLKRFIDSKFTFTASKSTEETWKFYQRNSSPVVCFIEECLTFTSDDLDVLGKEEIYQAFRTWMIENEVKGKISRNKFFKSMKDEGIEAIQSRQYDMKRMYFGVKCNTVTTSALPHLPQKKLSLEVIEETQKVGETRREKDVVTPLQKKHPTAQDIGRAVCEYRKTTLAKVKLAELIGVPLDRLKPVLEELEKKGAVRDMGAMVEVM